MRRQLAQREVTHVEKPQQGDVFGSLSETALKFADMKQDQDNIKMNEYLADANIKMMKTTGEWKAQNAGDPFNQEAIGELKKSYSEIFAGYDKNIGLMSRGIWKQGQREVIQQYEHQLVKWGTKQSIVNLDTSLTNARVKGVESATEYGRQGDLEGAKIFLGDQVKALRATFEGSRYISQDNLDIHLDVYKSSFTKGYISGQIQTDPEVATNLLNMKAIQNDIGSIEAVDKLKKSASTQLKRNKQDNLLQQQATYINSQLELFKDINNMPLGAIDQMKEEGNISESQAKILTNYAISNVSPVETDYAAYNQAVNKITGFDKKDGKSYSDEAVMMGLAKDGNKFTRGDMAELSESLLKRKDKYSYAVQSLLGNGIREFLTGIGMDSADVEKTVYRFNKEVYGRNLDITSMNELANRYEESGAKEIDPTFSIKDGDDIRNTRALDVGTVFSNQKTGERKMLNKEGQWIDL